MKILEAYIAHFGKLRDATFSFDGHINIIYGENGAGKTTFHAFLRSMLFGFQRGRGRKANTDEYSHYLPWEQTGAYGGSLRLENHGTVGCISRNFLKDPKDLSVFDETRSKPIQETAQWMEDMLAGLGETSYDGTLSVGQLCSGTVSGMAAELNHYVSNLHNSGSGSVSTSEALAELNKEKKKITAKLVPIKEQELTALSMEIEERQKAAEAYNQAGGAEVRQEQKAVQQELDEKRGRRDELDSYIAKWDGLLKAHSPSSVEEAEEMGTVMERAFEAYIANKRAGKLFQSPPARGMAALVELAFYGGCFAFLFLENFYIMNGVLLRGVAGFAISVLCFLAGRVVSRERERGQLWKKAEKQLQEIFRTCLAGEEDGDRQFAVTQKNYLQAKERLQGIVDVDGKVLLCKEDLGRLNRELIELQARENQLLTQLEAVNKADWENEQLQELLEQDLLRLEELRASCRKNEELQIEVEAIETAAAAIGEIGENYHAAFAPQLNKRSSEILSGLTNGAYTFMSLDEEMNLYIRHQGKMRPLNLLSRGTIDQVYLALRLALIECFWPQEEMPLVLDDAFALYDDGRREDALLWLSQNYKGQILLFTCHKKEGEILDRHGIGYKEIFCADPL